MDYIANPLSNLWQQTAFTTMDWKSLVMIGVALFFLYLAIRWDFEPLLLVPISFGMLLVNIYPQIMAEPVGEQAGGLLYYFFQLDEWALLPSLIFMGVGAMTDFGPLIANPKSFLLGAAAQFGIFAAYFMAIFMGFNDQAAAAISIIGGADGPTSIWVGGDAALTEGSTWHGSYEISNHAGKGELTNGSTEVWGLLGTSGERLFFELYPEPDFTGSTKPLLSCWARVEDNRIIPEIGEEDAWFLNIYLTEDDRDAMSFTLEDGGLGAQYFYYDPAVPEACDVIFTLTPFA
jgi:hypothetical protein